MLFSCHVKITVYRIIKTLFLLQWQSEYALWVSKMEQSGYSQQGSVGYFSSDMIMGGIRISALKVRGENKAVAG